MHEPWPRRLVTVSRWRRRILTLAAGALLVTLPALGNQMYTPLAVELGRADAVAVVWVQGPEKPEVNDGWIGVRRESWSMVTVEEVLAGSGLEPGPLRVRDPRNDDCFGSRSLAKPERRILAVERRGGEWWGIRSYPHEQQSTIETTLSQLPPWSEAIDGLEVHLVSSDVFFTVDTAGAAHLYLLIRNRAETTRSIAVTDWPPAEMLWAKLEVRDATGIPIPRLRVPTLDPPALDDFARHHARQRSIEIASGAVGEVLLPGFFTRGQGWGYRERFQFEAVEITTAGRYRITGSIHGLVPGRVIELHPLDVTFTSGH